MSENDLPIVFALSSIAAGSIIKFNIIVPREAASQYLLLARMFCHHRIIKF